MNREFNKHTDKRGNKDWRKPWVGNRKSCNFDRSCRNHKACAYCRSNRTHSDNKAKLEADKHIKEYWDND